MVYYRKQLESGAYAYYNGKYIRVGDSVILNPSEQMLIDNGYESYIPEVPPQTEPQSADILQALRQLESETVLDMPDKEAVKVAALFPAWYSRIGTDVVVGERLWYDNGLYKCLQPHKIQSTWNPKDAVSLWANVSEESQEADGSREHPYAWTSGMTCYNGKYYIEDNILYICTRDSGGPVYNRIADLPAGLYFQIAE